MREIENSFIVYNIDLPLTLYMNSSLFNKNINEIDINDIVAKVLNVEESPETNCHRIKCLFEDFTNFMNKVKSLNNKDLPIVYEELPIDNDEE